MITVRYSSIDGVRKLKRFKTLAGARRFAHKYVGPHPEISSWGQYAVSFDGVGKITMSGPDMSLKDLFPEESREPPATDAEADRQTLEVLGREAPGEQWICVRNVHKTVYRKNPYYAGPDQPHPEDWMPW